jgi:hypothetical protein
MRGLYVEPLQDCGVDEWSRSDGNQIELDAPNSSTEVVAFLVNGR